jgi:hypothetical protein
VTINLPNVTVRHLSGTDSIHSLTSSDPLLLDGGSLTIMGDSRIDASLEVRAGTLLLRNLTLSGAGTLTNESGLNLTNVTVRPSLANQGLLVAQGQVDVQGSFTNPAGATLRVLGDANMGGPGPASLLFDNGFTNNGLIELTSTGGFFSGQRDAALTVLSGSLTNAAGGTITSLFGNGGARTLAAQLHNDGALRVVDEPLVLDKAGAAHTNSGTIDVRGGDLTINQFGPNSSFTNTGSLTVAGGLTLTVSGGAFNQNGGAAGGAGTLALLNTTANLSADFLVTMDVVNVVYSAFNGPGALTIAPGTNLVAAGTTFNAPLVNQGLLLPEGGANAVTGAFTNSAGSTLLIQANAGQGGRGGANLTVSQGLTNNGLVELTALGTFLGGTTRDATLKVAGGTLTNAPAGTIAVLPGSGGARSLNAQLDNQGTFSVTADLTINKAGASHTNSGNATLSGNVTLLQAGPGASFSNPGTLTVTSGRTLTVNGGRFNPGGGTIGGSLQFNAVTLGSGTLSAASSVALSASNVAADATLVNQGLLLVQGTTNVLSGTFVNAAGATVRVLADAGAPANGTNWTVAGTATNDGTLELTSAGTTFGGAARDATLTVAPTGTFTNADTGRITVLAGTGGARTLSNLSTLLDAGAIDLGANSLTVANVARLTNQGTLTIASGSLTINQTGPAAVFTNTGTLDIAATKTLPVNGGQFDPNTGVLTGTGTLALNGVAVVGSGTLLSTTTTVVMTASSVAADSTPTNDALLILVGTGDRIAGTLTNAVDGTVRVLADASASSGGANLLVTGTLTNHGALELTATGTTFSGPARDVTLTVPSGTLTNAAEGSILVLPGSGGGRSLDAQFDNQGTLTVNANLSITKVSAAHSNSGTIDVRGGDLTLLQAGDAARFSNSGTVKVAAGHAFTLRGGTFPNFSAGTLSGGAYQVAGTFRFDGAAIAVNAATLVLDGPSARVVDAADADALAGLTANAEGGDFTLQNGRGFTAAGFANAGGLTVAAGSTFQVNGDYAQTGALRVAGGAVFVAGAFVQSDGSTALLDGALEADGGVNLLGGTLSGSGTVTGNVRNAGVVLVGGPANVGVLQIDGDYTQTSSATLVLKTDGGAFDRLRVAGQATLDGSLTVILLHGYLPNSDDRFTPLSYASADGIFARLNGDALRFDVRYGATEVTLVAF